MKQLIRVLSFAALLAGAGCTEDNPNRPSPGAVPVVETFVGTLPVGSSTFYSFTVPTEGNVALTLIELSDGGGPSATIVGLGIGSPLGTGCTAGVTISTAPGPRPQLNQSLTPGVYCVKVSDTGQIVNPVTFVLNITRPR
jgi:hypothetical protein